MDTNKSAMNHGGIESGSACGSSLLGNICMFRALESRSRSTPLDMAR